MDIQELRDRINEIDARLIRLFEDRMQVALEIARYKQEHRLPVYDPKRESEVLARQTAAVSGDMAEYAEKLYQTLFEVSKSYQRQYMDDAQKRFGLIGEKLGHSHSKTLHSLLADYRYDLLPIKKEELGAFLKKADFDGINVTIPYKQDVIPYLSEMGETACKIGSVNTIVKRQDGTLFGDNTDACGLEEMAKRAGMKFAGRKTLILGSGGTSKTAQAVVKAAGGDAVVVSRSGENNYSNLDRHSDAVYLINTTPVGMYPHTDRSPVDLRLFPKLEGVLDVIYNPLRTRLLQQADELGIANEGGLCMLVYQAVRACELFTGKAVSAQRIYEAETALRKSITNLVIVGMPGSGKSVIGRRTAELLEMSAVDLDEEISRTAGMSIPEIFALEGEDGFRARESEVIRRFALEGGRVLITGGGAVKNAANRELLRMNSMVTEIRRSLEDLATEGRPLSCSANALKALWQERAPLYASCADFVAHNDGTIEQCARKIKEEFYEALCAQRTEPEHAGRP